MLCPCHSTLLHWLNCSSDIFFIQSVLHFVLYSCFSVAVPLHCHLPLPVYLIILHCIPLSHSPATYFHSPPLSTLTATSPAALTIISSCLFYSRSGWIFFFFFNWDGFCKHKIIAIKAGREKWHTGLKYSVSHGFFSRYVGFHWNLGWPLER